MGRKPSPGAQERVDEEARTCCGCRFPLLLALLQLALGIAVTVLGFLMASISPSLLVRDTPFWAGIIEGKVEWSCSGDHDISSESLWMAEVVNHNGNNKRSSL
ncbi:hypothetical protein A6R68_05101 [Neotoma lepida]|uniref:Uncharacterized protein n=1 Tax=Neotoma lepida TaxID=56216 RepID=A0A1A6GJH5_NEOLE|nr:hypothetical protein A6R68_05101 [Neotoma lepida]